MGVRKKLFPFTERLLEYVASYKNDLSGVQQEVFGWPVEKGNHRNGPIHRCHLRDGSPVLRWLAGEAALQSGDAGGAQSESKNGIADRSGDDEGGQSTGAG